MTVNVLGRRLPATLTYVTALAVVLAMLIVAVSAAFWQTNRSEVLNQQVRESVERRSNYRILMQRVTDAETGQRGFMLTGDDAYLEPLDGAQEEAQGAVSALLRDGEEHPSVAEDAALARDLVMRKFEELERTIDLRRRGRGREAMTIINSDAGKATMDELRALFARVETRESAALNAALEGDDVTGRRLQLIILLAGMLIFGVGVLIVIAVRGAMSELRFSRDAALAARRQTLEEMAAREQAETKVRQMQKMEAIGQITGGVAHDFNNMLAVIMSALQLGRRRLDRGEPGVERFMDEAMDAVRRASLLTSRLLAFARRKPLSPQVIDVNRVIGDMSELLRRTLGEQISLETVLAGGLWRVNADRNELEQAILNICVNARDAMADGGKLTIEAANAHLDDAYAAANTDTKAGQYVLIAITDTGSGMPKDVVAKAFEPFFTTKEVGKGTGLGLSQVHGFLKQSGGHAAIYSEPGHGTTVKLYLPRTQLPQSAEAPEQRPSEEAAGDPSILILVVEDDDKVRTLSVEALREIGYTVLHASSGKRALEVLDQHPAIALLFTDVIMPEMNGKALADEARHRYPSLKVLFTTGYTQNAIVHNGVLDADARLLLKPFTLQDLARKVRSVLDEGGS